MSKTSAETLAKVYDPAPVEQRWWGEWEKHRLFAPDSVSSDKSPFCIVIPPPNVTGSLHMGHALNNTLQDILVRYHRMNGHPTLWVFGMDHAGIATQNVVERQLKSEGKTRHDLGRDAFIQRVWQWKEESGGNIRHQLKKLGASLDFEHERFTMDEGLSRAVKEVFIRLFEEGKIYRAQRLINWCPRCHTALSDLEVEHEQIHGHLWHIRYPLEGDPQNFITVATTRPETLLGDTAVAVHPDDERYQDWVGKKLVLPLVNRLIPVLADPMVDREFGSGAVKITPAHDFNDFEVGVRHNLERVNVLDETGHMNEAAGVFAGQDRFECRRNVVQALEEQGLLEQVEDYPTSVGHCYRCKTVVEPYLSMQWYVSTRELADRALEAVKQGETRILPQQWENTYVRWMEDIKDWCISRQIWWGHRIPIYYCGRCADEEAPGGGVIASLEAVRVCPRCGHNGVTQETDVLDTWFSSALWPFSTLGWPEPTELLKQFYPTSALVTAFDIIFFWVARMMMMGLHFTDQVPFKDVYIHALVRDAEGQKMSKSKGNVIDPLEVMEGHGTDAFRFTLAALAAQGRDIKISEERVLGYRNFCNKIWNASRFLFSTAHDFVNQDRLKAAFQDVDQLPAGHEFSQWILARLSETTSQVRRCIEEYRFNEAAMGVYHFFWGTFCDWYLEMIKEGLKNEALGLQEEFATVSYYVLDQSLRLLHPFMPFLTEELWQNMAERDGKYLPLAAFPQELPQAFLQRTQAAKEKIEALCAVFEKVRQIRMETAMPLHQELKTVGIYSQDGKLLQELQEAAGLALHLIRAKGLSPNDADLENARGVARGVTGIKDLIVRLDLKGLVDLDKERARQEKELVKIKKALKGNEATLKNPKFLEKSPPELQEEMRQNVAQYRRRIEEIEAGLEQL